MLNKFYVITVCCIFILKLTLAQTGLHDLDSKIQNVYFSEDGSKLLTVGYVVKNEKLASQEIVLWDRQARLPIWHKTLSDYGITEGSPNYYNFGIANRTLSVLTIEHSSLKTKYLLNLETNQSKIIDQDFRDFTYDGQLVIAQKDIDESGKKRKSTKLILKNYESNIEKIIDDFTYGVSLSRSGDKIIYFKKDFFKKSVVNFYEIKTNKYGILPLTKNLQLADQISENDEIVNIGTYYLKNETGEYCEFNSSGGTLRQGKIGRIGKHFYSSTCDSYSCGIRISDLSLNKNLFTLELSALREKNAGNKEIIFIKNESYSNSLFTIESGQFSQAGTSLKFSFLREYNFESGKLISEIPLSRLSDQAIVDAKIKYEQYRKREEEQQQYINSTEGKIKKRMFDLWNLILYSPSTKLIYHVVPDMPLYVGDLVKLIAMHGNKKEEIEVYEKIENVENREMYHVIKGYQQCIPCNGRGYFSNSYQSTVADYEYTSGKKLVRTTTISGACQNCGGCGLTPKN